MTTAFEPTPSSPGATAKTTGANPAAWHRAQVDIDLDGPAIRAGHTTGWHRIHGRRLFITDAIILAISVLVPLVVWFGHNWNRVISGRVDIPYIVFGLLMGLGWLIALRLFNTRDPRISGDDIEEYRRVVRATVTYVGILAIASIAFKIDISRAYLALALPLGLIGLLVGRHQWRNVLRRRRAEGAMVSNALVIGSKETAQEIATTLQRDGSAGYRVTGAWVPDRDIAEAGWLTVPGSFVPMMGRNHSLAHAIAVSEAQLVIISDTDHFGHAGLKELTWQLEEADLDLFVAPNVVDVSGSRLQMAAVGSMQLLHVAKPTYGEAKAWPKKLFDTVGAAALILMFSPVLIGLAIAVKATSPGPVFYRQQRIGRDGETFDMIKFRSMRQNSDAELAGLLAQSGQGLGPLAKLTDDPRVTSVGKFIRRYSLDELPQLFNVLGGSMSLVGPRPQRDFEVELYDVVASRRLRVLPGMTGLWQVSGRSDLTWDEAIRLDTFYVENWSLLADLSILWRTARAVIGKDGAY